MRATKTQLLNQLDRVNEKLRSKGKKGNLFIDHDMTGYQMRAPGHGTSEHSLSNRLTAGEMHEFLNGALLVLSR